MELTEAMRMTVGQVEARIAWYMELRDRLWSMMEDPVGRGTSPVPMPMPMPEPVRAELEKDEGPGPKDQAPKSKPRKLLQKATKETKGSAPNGFGAQVMEALLTLGPSDQNAIAARLKEPNPKRVGDTLKYYVSLGKVACKVKGRPMHPGIYMVAPGRVIRAEAKEGPVSPSRNKAAVELKAALHERDSNRAMGRSSMEATWQRRVDELDAELESLN